VKLPSSDNQSKFSLSAFLKSKHFRENISKRYHIIRLKILDRLIYSLLIKRIRLVQRKFTGISESSAFHAPEIDLTKSEKNAVANIAERIDDESRLLLVHKAAVEPVEKVKRNKVAFAQILSAKQWYLVGAIFLFVFFSLLHIFFSSNTFREHKPVKIEILPGMDFGTITATLYEKGVVENRLTFKITAELIGAPSRIKAGRYIFENGISNYGILEKLVAGMGDKLRLVKLFDGSTIRAFAERLQNENIVPADSFLLCVNDSTVIKKYFPDKKSLLGYLLPGSYELFEHSEAENVVAVLLTSFKTFENEEIDPILQNSGLTLNEVIILAAIVDGETNKTDEMPRIAGVYLNRLKLGMKLQADPTLQFLRSEKWGRVTAELLTNDSPYNTYKYYGLPPGPINNPGKDAIRAALNPEHHNYLFFVADTKGGHLFASTYEEHQKNAKAYYEWLEKKNSK
jgi:UPF0755 protein